MNRGPRRPAPPLKSPCLTLEIPATQAPSRDQSETPLTPHTLIKHFDQDKISSPSSQPISNHHRKQTNNHHQKPNPSITFHHTRSLNQKRTNRKQKKKKPPCISNSQNKRRHQRQQSCRDKTGERPHLQSPKPRPQPAHPTRFQKDGKSLSPHHQRSPSPPMRR